MGAAAQLKTGGKPLHVQGFGRGVMADEIKKIESILDLTPDANNANKHSQRGMGMMQTSIEECGFGDSITADKHGNVISGNGRVETVADMQMLDPIVVTSDGTRPIIHQRTDLDLTTDERAKRLAILQNRVGETNLEWDAEALARLAAEGVPLDDMFSGDELNKILSDYENAGKATDGAAGGVGDGENAAVAIVREKLTEKFLVPPFSVFDTRQGYWTSRAALWDALIGNVAATREGTLGFNSLSGNDKYGFAASKSYADNVSQLDPVMCEVSYKWFMPEGGTRVLNPFGGEPVSAIVAAQMGFHYTGIELRDEQIEQTVMSAVRLGLNERVEMISGDATQSAEILKDAQTYDLVFSSPPFYDLEVYSDRAEDLSNQGTYDDFMQGLSRAFQGAVGKLRNNAFAVINVTEIRDKKGVYRGFVPDTIRMMENAGMSFYNDIILVNSVGTAALRAGRYMNSRKVARVHQNVLVFYKGDTKDVQKHFNPIEVQTDVLQDVPDAQVVVDGN
jgi:hypothetical protein